MCHFHMINNTAEQQHHSLSMWLLVTEAAMITVLSLWNESIKGLIFVNKEAPMKGAKINTSAVRKFLWLWYL